MELTPELEDHLNKLVKLLQDKTYNLKQLSSSFNNYTMNVFLYDDAVIEATFYNDEGDITANFIYQYNTSYA